MRVGIIGTGFGERMMAPAWSATPGVEVMEVISPRDVVAVRRLCARRDVDLVSVHSPPFLHVRDVELVLEGGHAVLCDKPFGVNSVDAQRMLLAARQAGAMHFANLEFRLEPWRLAIRRLVRAGSLGRVESVDWHEHSNAWRTRGGGWQLDADRGGGWLAASVSHTVDTLRWLFGELHIEAARLLARRGATESDNPARAAEDTVEITGECGGRSRCRLRASGVDPRSIPARILVSGRQAAVERTTDGRLVLHEDRNAVAVDIPHAGSRSLASVLANWCAQVRAAVESGSDAGVPTLADGVAVAEILENVRAAATERDSR